MATNGLEILDKSNQGVHIWLNDITDHIGPDKHCAYRALHAVLHVIRDRLSVEQAVQLSSQLPLFIKGMYFDQWHPAGKPEKYRTADELCERISTEMKGARKVNPRLAAMAVMKAMSTHISRGEIEKIKGSMPGHIRALWDEAEKMEAPENDGKHGPHKAATAAAASANDEAAPEADGVGLA